MKVYSGESDLGSVDLFTFLLMMVHSLTHQEMSIFWVVK